MRRRGLAASLLLAISLFAAAAPTDTYEVRDASFLRGAALRSELMESIGGARERILVLMFILSSSDQADHPVRALVDELIEAKARGVDVMVVMDERFREKNDAAYEQFKAAGVDARFEYTPRILHTKLVVCDDEVFVGSANWSAIALTGGNVESTIRCRDGALADRLYALRGDFFTDREQETLERALPSLLAEARAAFRSEAAGPVRRALTAAGLDAEALAAAGIGWVPPGDTGFAASVRIGAGAADGWARWNLPSGLEDRLILPGVESGVSIIDGRKWKLIEGDFRAGTPELESLKERLSR